MQDICYSLLQLHSMEAAGDTVGGGSFVERCLQAASLTPHKAEGLVQWRLLCALQAIGALDTSTGVHQQVCTQFASLSPPLRGPSSIVGYLTSLHEFCALNEGPDRFNQCGGLHVLCVLHEHRSSLSARNTSEVLCQVVHGYCKLHLSIG